MALVGLLGACALFPRLELGQTKAQVVRGFGTPSRIVRQADGAELWQYATQPFGTTFVNVRFDAAGQVVKHWDALDEAYRGEITPGLSMAEVADRLGPHRAEFRFANSGETVRDWNVSNIGNPGIATQFNVHFRDGRVVRTSVSYVYARDRVGAGGWFGGFHIGSGGWGGGVGIGF